MNRLATWDPFKELNRITSMLSIPDQAELGKLEGSGWTPVVDISEDDEAYSIVAELPEVKKEDMKVTVEDGYLTISGERKFEHEEKDKKKKFHRVERSYGSYSRSFSLPDNVDASKVKAESKEGVLNVTIPKIEKGESSDSVEIEVE